MALNCETYEEAMRSAVDAAWAGNWADAVEAYREALRQSPDDVEALAGLGMAYAQIGKHSEASAAYRRARDLASDDPVLLERVGRALEELGRLDEACKAYLACGEQYIKQQEAPQLAIHSWESAARVKRSCVEARVYLLKHYQRQGEIRKAAQMCLDLARLYAEQGRPDYGMRICEHALRLSPRNAEAMRLLDALRRGRPVKGQGSVEKRQVSRAGVEESLEIELPDADTLDFRAEREESGAFENGSPLDRTRRRALAELAGSVFDEGDLTARGEEGTSPEAVRALMSRAIDLQTRGSGDAAIAAYEHVLEAGMDQAAVRFNLGLLYEEQLRCEEAVEHLESALRDPDYALGSHFALGECLRARGDAKEALSHFLDVLKRVDVATTDQGRASEFIELYDRLNDGYLMGLDEDGMLRYADCIIVFLDGHGWEERVTEIRRLLDAVTEQGPAITLAEALSVPNAQRILQSVARSQEYARQGMHYTAMEECHMALESSPGYLPVHRELAKVARELGRVEEAARKLGVIAETYEVRGAAGEAAGVYRQALKLAPMDTALRARLIDLLVRQGEIEQALKECLMLADSYQDLAQMDRALEVYEEALRLAVRVEEQAGWRVRILHQIGDLAMRRVDWKKALSVYGEIRELAPGDERARLTLMELLYRVKEPRQALVELDGLLGEYREKGRGDRVLSVLSDVVRRRPDSIPVRARLAQAHLNAGNKEEALEHLDRLGDLQLDAGHIEQAKATIRAIVALRPPDVKEYQGLLEQLADA